jgi:hypothetical protein
MSGAPSAIVYAKFCKLLKLKRAGECFPHTWRSLELFCRTFGTLSLPRYAGYLPPNAHGLTATTNYEKNFWTKMLLSPGLT